MIASVFAPARTRSSTAVCDGRIGWSPISAWTIAPASVRRKHATTAVAASRSTTGRTRRTYRFTREVPAVAARP